MPTDTILGIIVIIGFVLFIITRITKKSLIDIWKEIMGKTKERIEDIKNVRRI